MEGLHWPVIYTRHCYALLSTAVWAQVVQKQQNKKCAFLGFVFCLYSYANQTIIEAMQCCSGEALHTAQRNSCISASKSLVHPDKQKPVWCLSGHGLRPHGTSSPQHTAPTQAKTFNGQFEGCTEQLGGQT